MSGFSEHYFATQDGLSLYYRDYGDKSSPSLSFLCLPGLSRNSNDFHDLAISLSKNYRFICPDYRGRGRSEYDKNSANYHPRQLLNDIRHLVIVSGLNQFIAIGTSLGGIIVAGLGTMMPAMLKGAIINDIGPEIGVSGMDKIMNFIGRDHPQNDWNVAVSALKKMLPDLNLRSESEWQSATKGTFRKGWDGKLHIDWDPRIIEPILKHPLSGDLWPLFQSLKSFPILVFRGEHSKILTEDTLNQMAQILPKLRMSAIPGLGHAPSLNEPEARSAIEKYLELFKES